MCLNADDSLVVNIILSFSWRKLVLEKSLHAFKSLFGFFDYNLTSYIEHNCQRHVM